MTTSTDPLQQALRLRRNAVAAEQGALAEALAAENAAGMALARWQESIRQEIDAASATAAGDAAVEALGLWLKRARAECAAASEALARAVAGTARTRATLAAARSAEAAILALIDSRAQKAAREAASRDQAALDEAALRQHATAAPGNAPRRREQNA